MKIQSEKTAENKCDILEQLYTRYSKLMYHVAYSILKDHFLAEDAVQTAFLKLEKSNFKIDSISCNKTKAFVIIITRNASIRMYNVKKRENVCYGEDTLDDMPDSQSLPLELLISHENLMNVTKALGSLDAKYSDVIQMRYYMDFSIAEIAKLFDVTEQVIRVRLHRAKKLLMAKLSEEKPHGQKRAK
ncbi:MAG: sigma-70 family RNA polymerase sigma factor [Eubacteriales bacterium]